MRILFHGPSVSYTRPAVGLPHLTGIGTAKYVNSINDLRLAFNLTGNTGNMVHAEAPLKLLNYNNSLSAITDLHSLFLKYDDIEKFTAAIKENFDAVVLSLANLIRPDFDTNLYKILDAISVPFYILGVGLQNDVSLNSLRPSTQKLLRIMNDKARLFGVRGERTENWLHTNGFENAVALGCPSLYVYPESILSYKHIKSRPTRVMTAGHLSDFYLNKEEPIRTKAMLKILKAFNKVSYVFQDEPFTYKEILQAKKIWLENISQLDSSIMNSYLSIRLNKRINYDKFYMFFCTDAWRIACSEHDLYIGDRLHAGIAAHQAGIPSIILYDDCRVKELADFYNFPSASIEEIMEESLSNIIALKLSKQSHSKFNNSYIERYTFFVNQLENSGLTLKNKFSLSELESFTDSKQLVTSSNSIIERADFLKKTIRSDGAEMLFYDALESSIDPKEFIQLLRNEEKIFSNKTPLFKLFIIEKLIDNKINVDVDSILKDVSSSKIDRAEHRKITTVLEKLEGITSVSVETIESILSHSHSDSFDACIKQLIKLNYNKRSIELLEQKVSDGFGTRVRVSQLLNLLLKIEDMQNFETILTNHGHYLSDQIFSTYKDKLKG